ncbi:MAG: hypothetical protein JWN20_1487, partial [Jatrophihabitantaceae bacterium]|nr:hypothetical protein [Jatrophihabitantaceae bacterium]
LVALLPPAGRQPGDAPASEEADDGDDDQLRAVPPAGAVVMARVADLVSRLLTGSLRDATAAVQEALAITGLATMNGDTVLVPAVPPEIDGAVLSDETALLAVAVRGGLGTPASEYLEWMFAMGPQEPSSPDQPAPSIEMTTLAFIMLMAQWLGAGLGAPDDLGLNFVPQYLAAMARARHEPETWMVNGEGLEQATLDALAVQLIANSLRQTLMPKAALIAAAAAGGLTGGAS